MNFTTKVLEHDFVSEQCKWNCPLMVWNAPSWPLKGDNWKIQDTAVVREGTSCSNDLTTAYLIQAVLSLSCKVGFFFSYFDFKICFVRADYLMC